MNISHDTSVLEFFNDHCDKSYYLCTTLDNSCATRAQLVHNSGFHSLAEKRRLGISIYYSLIIYHAINVKKLVIAVRIVLVHLLQTLEIHQAKMVYVQKIIFCRLQYSKETFTTF